MSVKAPMHCDLTLYEAQLPNGHHRFSGSAIHPCKTYHPKEWPKVRLYIEPYLERAAPGLVKARMVIDHDPTRKLSEGNFLTKSVWNRDTSSVDFEGEITEEIYRMFKNGILKPHVSVGVDWLNAPVDHGTIPYGSGLLSTPEGILPYNFSFEEFSLVQDMTPGDQLSTVELWEGLLEGIVAAQNAQSQAIAEPQFSRSALAPPPTGVEQPLIEEVTEPSERELRAKERLQRLGIRREYAQMVEQPIKEGVELRKEAQKKRVIGVFGSMGGSGGRVISAIDPIEGGNVYQSEGKVETQKGAGETENPFIAEPALDPIDRLRRLLHEV